MHFYVSIDSHIYAYMYAVKNVYRAAFSATHCNTTLPATHCNTTLTYSQLNTYLAYLQLSVSKNVHCKTLETHAAYRKVLRGTTQAN